jgi:hypothetical protein
MIPWEKEIKGLSIFIIFYLPILVLIRKSGVSYYSSILSEFKLTQGSCLLGFQQSL